MKNCNRIVALLSVCLLIVLGAAGAGCAAEGKKVLKIAFASPLTGESAKAGTEMKDAANMAWEEAGYKVGDYTIEPLWVDVTTDPERGALALERAIIRDGAQVVTLSWNSSVVMSLMDVVAKYKIPYYFGHGASAGTLDEKWRSNPEKYSYFIAKGSAKPELLAANAYISVISEAIENGSFKATNRNVAIIGDDTDFGRSIGDAIRDSFVAAGWSKVYEDYFVMGTTDFFAQISKIKASNPSVIGGAISSPASAASFIKQARELGINAVIICDALSENADYYELTGDAVNGVLDSRPAWTEKSKTFEDAFKAKYGYAPSPFNGGHVYDYTHFFIKCCEGAIAKYGALDSETLYKFAQEVLLKGEITYTDGIVIDCYKFTDDSAPSPVVGEGYYTFPVLQFMGPVINVVWPASQANAKFQQPQ